MPGRSGERRTDGGDVDAQQLRRRSASKDAEQPQLDTGARAILALQRAIGNRATARALGGGAADETAARFARGSASAAGVAAPRAANTTRAQRFSIAEEEAEEVEEDPAAVASAGERHLAAATIATGVAAPVSEDTAAPARAASKFGALADRAAANTVTKLAAQGPRNQAEVRDNYWGFTWPESVTIALTPKKVGNKWVGDMSGMTGRYSIMTRLLAGVTEVAAPVPGKFNAQLRDLRNLSVKKGKWFMLKAIADHEAVHATRFQGALDGIEAAIKLKLVKLKTPETAAVDSPDKAAPLIRAMPEFAAAKQSALDLWQAAWLVAIANDHNGTAGPTYDAERAVVNPMIAQIVAAQALARAARAAARAPVAGPAVGAPVAGPVA